MNPDGVTATGKGFSHLRPFFISPICILFNIQLEHKDLMNSIEFDAPFGDKPRHIKLSSDNTGGYQILIDNYYHGKIIKVNGEWRAHLNDKSDLTGDNIIDTVEKQGC